jgi:putative ABC transport system permease protein
MDRRQVRAMVRVEAVFIALLGCIVGVALGVGFGAALVRSLHSVDIEKLVVPWPWLAVVFVVAYVAGVASAVLPARRAARLDLLVAVATE